MAKNVTPKTATDGRDKKGRFTQGNKAAEHWTEEATLEVLNKMWQRLTTDMDGNPPEDGNIVRANDIKLQGEICLMFDIDLDTWGHWKKKFQYDPENPASSSVGRLIKKICNLLECRLNYSAGSMDIFILKAHYGYKDRVDLTTGDGEAIQNPFYAFLKETSAGPAPDEPAEEKTVPIVKRGRPKKILK